jgi:putative sigma-54 modulation protein
MMQTIIYTRGFVLTQALRNYTNKRLAYAVSYFSDRHIERITVRLSDINGPRGGEDKLCQLVLKIKGMPSVIIEDIESNLYTAIDRAVDRASRALVRLLKRKHMYQLPEINYS